jgi:hypothetical protein
MFSDIEVRDMRDQGIQNGRKLEFTEAYDDRYDKPLIQIFDPALQGQELEQAVIGEYLHEAPRRSAEYATMRSKLNEIKPRSNCRMTLIDTTMTLKTMVKIARLISG